MTQATPPPSLPHLCTERSPLLPIPEDEQQRASDAQVPPLEALLPLAEEEQEELVSHLQPLDIFFDPQSLIASPDEADEEMLVEDDESINLEGLVSGLSTGNNGNNGNGNGHYGTMPPRRRSSRHHHRRTPTWSNSYRFDASLLEEILGDREGEESIALDALFDLCATTPDLPLQVEELVTATVLIVEEELDYGDLQWSLLSNTFFIFGGLLEAASAIWELVAVKHPDNTKVAAFLHIAVGILGPFVYFLNSLVDILWALRANRRQQRREQLDDLDIDLVAPNKEAQVVQVKTPTGGRKLGRRKTRVKIPFEPHNAMRRLRVFLGNRRKVNTAIFFGIGGLCEFASAYYAQFNPDVYNQIGSLLDAISCDAYLASAAISLYGAGDTRVHKAWIHFWNDSSRLGEFGDFLFGSGALMDVIIFYLHLANSSPGWDLVSAVLWLLDAIAYLRTDCLSMKVYKAKYPLGKKSGENSSGRPRSGSESSGTSETSAEYNNTPPGPKRMALNRQESPSLDMDQAPSILPLQSPR